MRITGIIENIVFFNEENGYSVLELDVAGAPVNAVGNLPKLSEGEQIELEGEFINHAKFGRQFKCGEMVSRRQPSSLEGITRYLGSGLIKGVGPAIAASIVERFKGDTLKIIETKPDELKKIRGISLRKALDISNSYNEIKRAQEQIMYLQGHNITVNTALKIYNVYKQRTREILEKNPYRLIDDVDGIGFVTADRLANKMGIEADSEFRLRAGVVYVLKENGEKSGNTYLPLSELLKKTSALLGVDGFVLDDKIEGIFDGLALEDMIKSVVVGGDRCIALSRYYTMEYSIAKNLIRLKNDFMPLSRDMSTEISEFERLNNIKLHGNQIRAVLSSVDEGVSVITGGPGTGKTTIIKCILSVLKMQRLRVALVAPTGRASKRLSEATGESATTIHRLLGLDYTGGKAHFNYNNENKLECDCIIVDEVSMVDAYILFCLLKAVRRGARVIFVGDKDQLPSVGAGNVLSDIIGSKIINVSFLTYIYRQAQESLIVYNAHRINSGKMPELDDNKGDFFYSQKGAQEDILSCAIDMCCNRLPKFTGVSPENIQVLAPLKNGVCGVENLNRRLQDIINPRARDKHELTDNNVIFRTGDKVMQTSNNYQLEWSKTAGGYTEHGMGVFNGDIGFIRSIDLNAGETVIEFEDNRTVRYTLLDLKELILAYAITIHKSQGSEFDVVVLPIVSGPYTILSRNLLYTAVTRAKKTVLVIGERKNIETMVKNNYTAKRHTLLNYFLSIEQEKLNPNPSVTDGAGSAGYAGAVADGAPPDDTSWPPPAID
jgi:exodeoxyribonuclease V alpha subunit